MSERRLFVRVRGKIMGPFGHGQLKAMRDRGQFRSFHEVSEDRQVWGSAAELTEFFSSEVEESPPPVEMPVAVGQPTIARRERPSVVDWKGFESPLGWSLFWVLLVTELVIGFIYGLAWALVFTGRLRFDDLTIAFSSVVALVVIHIVIWIFALIWVARESRRYIESAAPWLILMWFLQSLGLALYMLSRPRRHD